MTTATTIEITNTQDVIDSREIIKRIEYLEDVIQDAQDELSDEQDETEKNDEATCGECGLTWNDAAASSKTPTPGGRCPFEYVHEEARELKTLHELADQAEGYAPDWSYGATLIRDSHFTEYAEELCKEIGDVRVDVPWYIEIDWEKTARHIQTDYAQVDFDGVAYWIR